MSTNNTGTSFVSTTRLIFVSTPHSSAILAVHRKVFDILVNHGLKEGVDYDFNIESYVGYNGSERRLFIYLTESATRDLGDYYAKFMPVVRNCAAPLFVESSLNTYTPSPYAVLLPPNDAVTTYLSNTYAEVLLLDPAAAEGMIINPEMVAAFFATIKDEGKNKLFKETAYSFDLTDKENVERIKADLGIRNTFVQLADVRYVPERGIEVDISIPGRPVTTHVYNNIAKSVIAHWRT